MPTLVGAVFDTSSGLRALSRSRARVPVALACLCLLAACSGASPPVPVTPAVRAPSTAAANPLPAASGPEEVTTAAQAQQLVFANRYDDADTAYNHLIRAHPDDLDARTGYALFLTYRLEFAAARAQVDAARAVAPADVRVLAMQCRVADWSTDLNGAVSAGQAAVKAGPDNVLAHVFLSEALADHGDLDAAHREVDAARALVTTGTPEYEQAELQREIGNLARDQGVHPAELAAFQKAMQIQPHWVERPSELAGAYLDNSDLAGAHEALHLALQLAPDEARLLLSLGSISMLQGDYDSADAALGRLAALRPHDAVALALAAHARMAHTGDVDTSAALLEAALSVAPSDVEAASYLAALDRYVRDDPARGQQDLAAAVAVQPDDGQPGRPRAVRVPPNVDVIEADHQQRALAVVNGVRLQAGLAPVVLDPALNAAAVQHCYYWLFNNGSDTVRNLGIHQETPGLPGYRGVRAGDRANRQGWHSGPISEDITHRGSPEAGVNDWVNSVYHRFPILRADLSAIGYGDCAIGSLPMEDMEFGLGNGGGDHHAPVPYPADGMTGVPSRFVDNELPDPVPAGRPRTTGYPVTVHFDPRENVVVAAFTVVDGTGRQLDGYRLQPGPATENCASLLPVLPLTAGGHYTGHIAGSRGGQAFDLNWSFTAG